MPFFFFNDTATTEIYTLSLHDALPICLAAEAPAHVGAVHHPRSRPRGRDRRLRGGDARWRDQGAGKGGADIRGASPPRDRKSTRLNSSHDQISYAVFCLKKKNTMSSIVCYPTVPGPGPTTRLSQGNTAPLCHPTPHVHFSPAS